jgi:peptidyl-tRNA hydrolase
MPDPQIHEHSKLYIVTRADLSPGQQATQSAHAAFEYAMAHTLATREWFDKSTYLVLLSVPDKESLYELSYEFDGMYHSVWHEPDMNDEMTAIAIGPSDKASRILANFPLTLRREPAMV